MEDVLFEIASTAIVNAVTRDVKWEPDLKKYNLKELSRKSGAFTTLYSGTKDNKNLRGCIGVPYPTFSLGIAVARSAYGSAITDPRFPIVREEELKTLLMSLEILGSFEIIKYNSEQELFDQIVIGKDGLLIESHGQAGLLLPRVSSEYHWGVEKYLGQICSKARLPYSAIMDPKTKLSRFGSELFEYFDRKLI